MKYGLTKRMIAGILCFSLLLSSFATLNVRADSSRIVTIGKDVSADGRASVLKFFGLTESDLKSIEVLSVNNQEEHALLDGILPNSVIGSKTYSCAYIEPKKSGGLVVKTANLTYVTSSSIHNALQTAGVENANIIVTAPFEVSGTGALTGIFKAYELKGDALNGDKQALAAEELITSSDMEEDYGDEVPKMITELKQRIAEEDLDEDQIASLIDEVAAEYGIQLDNEDRQKLEELLSKVNKLDYDSKSFSDELANIKKTVNENSGLLSQLMNLITVFFANILGSSTQKNSDSSSNSSSGSSDQSSGTSGNSIFDNVDTSVFNFDAEDKSDSEETQNLGDAGEIDDDGDEGISINETGDDGDEGISVDETYDDIDDVDDSDDIDDNTGDTDQSDDDDDDDETDTYDDFEDDVDSNE